SMISNFECCIRSISLFPPPPPERIEKAWYVDISGSAVAAACNILPTPNSFPQRRGRYAPACLVKLTGMRGPSHRLFSFRTVTAAPHGHFDKRCPSSSGRDRPEGDFSWAITSRDLI